MTLDVEYAVYLAFPLLGGIAAGLGLLMLPRVGRRRVSGGVIGMTAVGTPSGLAIAAVVILVATS